MTDNAGDDYSSQSLDKVSDTLAPEMSVDINSSTEPESVIKSEIIVEESTDSDKVLESIDDSVSKLDISGVNIPDGDNGLNLPLFNTDFEDPLATPEMAFKPEEVSVTATEEDSLISVPLIEYEKNDLEREADNTESGSDIQNDTITQQDYAILQELSSDITLEKENYLSKSKNVEPFVRGRPSACVFVASLCSGISDDELCISVTNHFQQWGKLSTVKVLRDTSNRPYAFVQYTNEQDSRNAIANGHNSILDGRSIRCEAAKVNRTLYVIFHEFLSKRFVKSRMDKFGEIESLVPSDIHGSLNRITIKTSKYWFVKFVYREDAIRAFANLTDDDSVEADWAQNVEDTIQEKENKYENLAKFDKYSIFVGQIHPDITETELTERFERHGEIEFLNLIKKNTHNFAFIKYQQEFAAASAVERENHSILNGKTMHVQYRENHVAPKKLTTNSFGIALAPPPINLKRKVFVNNGGTSLSTTSFNDHSVPKTKFNGYSSNNVNRNFVTNNKVSQKNFQENISYNEKIYGGNPSKSYANKSFRGTTTPPSNIRHKRFSKTYQPNVNKIENLRVAQGGMGLEITPRSLKFQGYNPEQNDRRIKKFDFKKHANHLSTKSPVLNTTTKASSPKQGSMNEAVIAANNNAAVPYYYYIPETEGASAGGPGTPNSAGPTSYYNPYSQYYVPNNDYSGASSSGYGMNPYSAYYPGESEFSPVDNKPVEKK